MKNKWSFFIWLTCTLLCMAGIFAFSALSADKSTEQSDRVINILGLPLLDTIVVLVRKAAHFVAYAGLGFCAVNTLKHLLAGRKLFLTSLVFSSFYAVTDEVHQLFVPGRAGMFIDWVIDTLGALAGIGVLFLWKRVKKRQEPR